MGVGILAAQGADGDTPLHQAAAIGHEETVRMLVELGGDVHAQATDGRTPLHLAASRGHAETARRLVKMGGVALAQDALGNTLLHCAAGAGHVETVTVETVTVRAMWKRWGTRGQETKG
jgi:ankyrin repeat protein